MCRCSADDKQGRKGRFLEVKASCRTALGPHSETLPSLNALLQDGKTAPGPGVSHHGKSDSARRCWRDRRCPHCSLQHNRTASPFSILSPATGTAAPHPGASSEGPGARPGLGRGCPVRVAGQGPCAGPCTEGCTGSPLRAGTPRP